MGYQFFDKLATQWMEDRPGKRWDSDILRAVKNPLRGYDKESMPLWSFYILNPTAERNAMNHVRANGRSVSKIAALIVDYDSGISPWEVHDTMKAYTHAIYTSPGHKTDHPKFRMILPLEKPMTNSLLLDGAGREYFVKQFPGCDNTTFDGFRRQRLPHVPLDPKSKYEYYVNTAKLFSVNESLVPQTVEQDDVSTSTAFAFENDRKRDALLIRYAEELRAMDTNKRGGGVVHYALKRYAYALMACGMSAASVKGFLVKNTKPSMAAEISQLVRWAKGRIT